jgi:riboflavin biosynthesis pyrimidine reductase
MEDWFDTYPELVGVRLNMIVGAHGEFVDETGSSKGLSNELDRKLIGHLRRRSDVVVTGGNTARAEEYSVPSHCALAVISSSFELTDERYIRLPNPAEALETLRGKGFERILLETGPTLSRFFLESNQVDEFCLTVAGGDLEVATKTITSFHANLRLVAADSIEGTLFTRWRRGND